MNFDSSTSLPTSHSSIPSKTGRSGEHIFLPDADIRMMNSLWSRQLRKRLSRGLSGVSNSKQLSSEGGIKLKNSLVSTIQHPVPTILRFEDNAITWYSCGPTVYDAAHIGHARTYVCTDIIRRILTDIHNKDVNFAVGVTDIDDKIIDRAILNGLRGWAETELMVRSLEEDFFEDLDTLNVRRPDAVLRVTEHIDEIIQYIQQILDTGRSYVTPDGVYFSVPSCGDSYIQFQELSHIENTVPDTSSVETETAGHSSTEAEGRHKAPPLGNKRDRRDFALWKTVKEGEPFWDSPWGPGRPGWHIECSAITHSYFGPKMDIHSGGIDLQFPHHTNEIAQCAAHNCTAPSEWVKFWIHTGHLYIEGRKMSKSLKNFISIKEYLNGSYSTHPAVDFRIFCLMYKYHSSVHFSQTRIDEAGTFRRKIENYLKLSEAVISSVKVLPTTENSSSSSTRAPATSAKPTDESAALRSSLSLCRITVSAALTNDFDTPEALRAMSHLVGDAMKYASVVALSSRAGPPGSDPLAVQYHPVDPLLAVSHYLTSLLSKLGVDLRPHNNQTVQGSSSDNAPGIQTPNEEALLESLLAFRSKVRASSLTCMKSIKSELKSRGKATPPDAMAGIVKGSLGEVLEACDTARVTVGSRFGVQIEDVSESVSIWRPAAAVKAETEPTLARKDTPQ